MFSKSVSASLVEATKKVMKDEESGLRMAAHAAHRQGKKMFHFQGKTYPITVKENNVEIGAPLDEAEAPYKEKTPTGMRVYGSSYGNSAKAKRDQSRHAVDDVRGPSKKDMEKAHTEKNPEHYKDKNKDYVAKQYKKDSVQKYFSKIGEENHDDEKEDKSLIKKMVKKDALNKEGYVDDIVAKARASGMNAKVVTKADKERDLQAVIDRQKKAKEKAASNSPSDSMIGKGRDSFGPNRGYGQGRYMGDSVEVGSFAQRLLEREMTSAEAKKKEKIVMSMKDKTEYFKKKYGKNWKNVMYATATKNAMKEEVELDEADITTDMLRGRVEGGKDMHGMTGDFKSFKVKLKGELEKRPEESDVTKPNTDNQGETAERQKITTNPGPVDIKMDDKYGHPNNHDHGQYYDPQRHSKYDMTKTGMRHEEVGQIDELSKKTLSSYIDKAKDRYVKHASSTGLGGSDEKRDSDNKKSIKYAQNMLKAKNKMEEIELSEKNESHTHAAHYENDKGEWTGMNLLVAKDDEDAIKQAHEKCKEGCRLSRVERHIPVKEEVELDEAKDPHIDAAVGAQPNEAMGHTPLSRAKEMARNAMKRVKTEMLGKAPGNN